MDTNDPLKAVTQYMAAWNEADPSARNDDVLTAAELAERAGHDEVAATIHGAGG